MESGQRDFCLHFGFDICCSSLMLQELRQGAKQVDVLRTGCEKGRSLSFRAENTEKEISVGNLASSHHIIPNQTLLQ
jgi:hypothetical protein